MTTPISNPPAVSKYDKTYRRTSLAAWVLSRMGALMLALGVIFLVVTLTILNQRFDSFEAEQYQNDTQRVALALEKERVGFAAFLEDWSNWNDYFNFVKTKDPRVLSENMTAQALGGIQMDAILILDASKQVLLARQRTSAEELIALADAEAGQWVGEFDFSSFSKAKAPVVKLIWREGVPVLLGASPINTSDRRSVSNGYLMFTRKLGEAFFAKNRALTGVRFNLIPVAANTDPNAEISEIGLIPKVEKTKLGWRVKAAFPELATTIVVEGMERLGEQRFYTAAALLINVTLMCALTLIGIFLILDRRVLQRIGKFSRLVDLRRSNPNIDARWPVQGRDELDNLALSVNGMLAEIKVRHDELRHLSDHDTLTTIGNRRKLIARLNAVKYPLDREIGVSCCLMLFDLDGFKNVNDGMGHHVGDAVLKEVAQRITNLIRDSDLAVRLGGDEFAILLEDIDLKAAASFGERVHACLAMPFEIDARPIAIRASIGVTQVRVDLDAGDILRNADLAMYEAKRRGKGCTAVFDESLLNIAARGTRLEQELRKALDEERLEVWFQPIVIGETGAVAGMEALTRWKLDGYFVPPDEFIPIAERCGLIAQLGKLVMERACAALALLRHDYPDLTCSVNVSALQFLEPGLSESIELLLKTYELPAKALHLEFTESQIASYEEHLAPVMRALVARGLHFHLDDFGTGYSSLERLRELPFETLKIDRSFVIPLRTGDDVMVRNIIKMGQDLGMNVIGEGVETEEEFSALLALGCTQMQGYLFGRAMPLEKLITWFSERQVKSMALIR